MTPIDAGEPFPPVVLDNWLPPQVLSPNARVHWRTKAAATKRVHADVWLHVQAARWPRQEKDGPRRRLTITLRRPRLMDGDNATAQCKAVLDSVAGTRALWDDAPRWAELVVIQEKGAARTTLELQELSDAATIGPDASPSGPE